MVIGLCQKALRFVEKTDAANELKDRVLKAGSYDEALTICREYVDF